MYTIGQVSERFDLPVSTLRYYDKEGLFPALTPGGSPIPLHLLTTGGSRTPAELRAIETLVHTRVYGKTPAAMV